VSTAAAATNPAGCGRERDKKSATTFFKPGRYNNCTLNSEINARWRCCLGEMGAEIQDRVEQGVYGRSKVESTTFTKMSKIFYCCLGGQ
jgi:hypothetical protein